MKFEITDSPNSYLKIDFEKNEKIIVEKGCLMYSNGEYIFENKIEGGFKNLIAKVFGGKSLTFNVYTAKETMEMAFSAKDTAEIFCIEIVNNKSTEKKLSEQGLYTINHIPTYLLPLLNN